MKDKEFEIYREGYFEGYKKGLEDMGDISNLNEMIFSKKVFIYLLIVSGVSFLLEEFHSGFGVITMILASICAIHNFIFYAHKITKSKEKTNNLNIEKEVK